MNMSYPIPENEVLRVERLKAYEILDTSPEDAFDRVARVAAHVFEVPIALVSLVDENRQWFKARFGLDVCETPRELAFCAHAIAQSDMLVIPDATQDDRFSENALVTGAPDIRFYAGAQLRTYDGLALGTLCVIDTKPRSPTQEQLDVLKDLADMVMDALSLRRAGRMARAQARDVAGVSSLRSHFIDSINHEIRNPLTAIIGALTLVNDGSVGEVDEEASRMLGIAKRNSQTLLQMVSDTLDIAKLEQGQDHFSFETCDFTSICAAVFEGRFASLPEQFQRMSIDAPSGPQRVYADTERLANAIHYIVSNALQHSPAGSPVEVKYRADIETVGLDIISLGPTIPPHERMRAFKPFEKLDGPSSEHGLGLGLSLARAIIEAHGGEIGIRAHAPEGNRVFFDIPRDAGT